MRFILKFVRAQFHNTLMCMSDYRRSFDLVIGLINHLQIVTTRNHIAIANSHTQQFIMARIYSSQSEIYPTVVAW
jgi:histidinol phosphatase-like PHP family hydrolase